MNVHKAGPNHCELPVNTIPQMLSLFPMERDDIPIRAVNPTLDEIWRNVYEVQEGMLKKSQCYSG